MNNCDKFQPLFSSYLEGDLLPDKRKSLEEHLSICPPCAKAIRSLKEICNSLRSMQVLTTSPDFEYRLHRQIANIGNGHSIQFSFPVQNWKIPAAASLVVLGGVSAFLIVNSTDQSSVNVPVRPSTTNQVNPHKAPESSILTNQRAQEGNNATMMAEDSLKNDSSRGLRNQGIKLIDEK